MTTQATANMPPMPATSSVGRSPIVGAEHGARERAERHRAPDHEPHRRVHPAEHPVRRDRLAQAHLVDVVERAAEAEQQPRDHEVHDRVRSSVRSPRRSIANQLINMPSMIAGPSRSASRDTLGRHRGRERRRCCRA